MTLKQREDDDAIRSTIFRMRKNSDPEIWESEDT